MTNIHIVEQYDDNGTEVEVFSSKRTAEEYAAALVTKYMVDNWNIEKDSIPKFHKLDDAREYADKIFNSKQDLRTSDMLPQYSCYTTTLNNTCHMTKPVFTMMKQNYMIRERGFNYEQE